MPALIYHDSIGQYHDWPFMDKIRIGSDPTRNDLVLPEKSGIMPEHVVIIHSAVNRLHTLINLAGRHTRVNGRPVVSIHVLRQRDELQLGQMRLKLWELRITRLSQADYSVGKTCLICTRGFLVGDEVFLCPRCGMSHHRDCWFSVRNCANFTCEYPVQARVMDALSPWVSFERYEDSASDVIEVRVDRTIIIRRGLMTCHANTRVDQVPFQPGELIAYCPSPSCRDPFHLQCWLMLPMCPRCKYNVRHLIDQVFSSGEDNIREPGGSYAG